MNKFKKIWLPVIVIFLIFIVVYIYVYYQMQKSIKEEINMQIEKTIEIIKDNYKETSEEEIVDILKNSNTN